MAVYSSMWANRSRGSLDNHPPLSYIRAALSTLATNPRTKLAHKRGGSMRILRPSLSVVLRAPFVLLLLTPIVPVSVLPQECTAGNAPQGAWLYDVTDERTQD